MNLALHLLSGLFLYLAVLAASLVAAVSAFVVYTFAPETLWFQSNVYMSDMFAQPLFLASIYLVVRLAKTKSSSSSFWFQLGAVIFLFAYSEWLGVMFALSLLVFFWRTPSIINRQQLFLTVVVAFVERSSSLLGSIRLLEDGMRFSRQLSASSCFVAVSDIKSG
jgi:hypothetical protein